MDTILLVYCTAPDPDTARELARTLVEERLAALRQKVEIAAGFRTFLSRHVLTRYDPSTS